MGGGGGHKGNVDSQALAAGPRGQGQGQGPRFPPISGRLSSGRGAVSGTWKGPPPEGSLGDLDGFCSGPEAVCDLGPGATLGTSLA